MRTAIATPDTIIVNVPDHRDNVLEIDVYDGDVLLEDHVHTGWIHDPRTRELDWERVHEVASDFITDELGYRIVKVDGLTYTVKG